MKEPKWIDERDAFAIHGKSLVRHGGAVGIRDLGLLQSALGRPKQLFAYGEKPSLISMAAAYTSGVVQNHPFIDGNKRVGFLVGVLFLEHNGYRFTASEEDAAQTVLELAAGSLDEPGYTEFLKQNSSGPKAARTTRT